VFVHTLTDDAKGLLGAISRSGTATEFYLAGGSAAALHLGHRVSVDLDFFTENDDYEPEPLQQSLRRIGPLTIQQQGRGTLVAALQGVQISFFAYPYPVLEPFAELEGARIASLPDIALMKIVAIGQRGRMRDFVDLHAICAQGYPLEDLLHRLPRKYPDLTYPSYHIFRSLVYFDDAERDVPPRMLSVLVWDDVKAWFERNVKDLMGGLLA